MVAVGRRILMVAFIVTTVVVTLPAMALVMFAHFKTNLNLFLLLFCLKLFYFDSLTSLVVNFKSLLLRRRCMWFAILHTNLCFSKQLHALKMVLINRFTSVTQAVDIHQ